MGSEDEARRRMARAGFFDEKETASGLMYVRRREHQQTLPLELVDIGGGSREETSQGFGWDFSRERGAFVIKSENPSLHAKILTDLCGFKQDEGSEVLTTRSLRIMLIQSQNAPKWHVGFHAKLVKTLRDGFREKCDQLAEKDLVFGNISMEFLQRSTPWPDNGIFNFSVPGLTGFTLELMTGTKPLKSHRLELPDIPRIGTDESCIW